MLPDNTEREDQKCMLFFRLARQRKASGTEAGTERLPANRRYWQQESKRETGAENEAHSMTGFVLLSG
jgi:hypothetical protein